jgi:uncharacterized caspase-like protein
MGETTSLTDAVKSAAGISLTEAVKGVAARRIGLADAALDTPDDAPRRPVRHRARRLLAACARIAAIAVLSLAFLLAGSLLPTGSQIADADRQAPAVTAKKRVALVIGNSAYRYTPRLENPRNDATDMAAALRKLGFEVLEGFDLDKAAFERRIRDFAAALQGADVGVFFYAGHGLLVSDQNYLVPVDAQLSTVSALDFEMVRLDLVHRTMEREAQTSILFFDACRDNPLARNLARAMGTRSTEIGPGLAPVQGGVGTLIGFSTQPGKVALDGKGRNSPFAGALVRQLGASNDDLSAILIAVRNDVMKETDRRQVPWEHSALTGRFFFNPAAQASAPAPAAAPAPVPAPATAVHLRSSEAAEAWNATKDTTNVAVLGAFVARYRDTFYAELARARIADLQK